MQAVKAEYGYQKANIIGNMIGQTATMIVLVAMASTGVGALIAAIIALLDIISMIACKYLSEKQIRSTAGQWLCGGISGIAAKFLSPYAASIVVDPNDPFSRYQNITGGGGLSRNIDGFSKGNSYRNTLAVTDYVQKMPFPAQWQSVFFAWQWIKLDERETSFVYALNSQQIDMRDSAIRGAQVGDWLANSANNTDFYSDGDYTYKWKKTFNVEYSTPLTNAGANVQMSDLWLSEAFKVPQQTCISIPNPIIFWPLIPICWIETLSGNPKYTNINEDSKTIFDVFPSTIDEFVSLRQKNNGYTFAWTDDNVQPTFPVFVDADNDGVPNSSELLSNTFDNKWDSDTDGISDYSEINVTHSKPNVIDSDNDGLGDSQEILYGTDPLKPDSDGDGLLDGEEIIHLDANGAATGGWQVTYAIVNGLPQTTWTGSDPTTADGDDDGITDLREKVLGWSPYAKNSAELIGLAGDVREALIPIVQSTFVPITATSFSNTGYSGSGITCADVASCPMVTSSGVRLPNTTALQFDGSDKLDAGSGPQATFDSQFTLSLWVMPTYQSAPHTIFVQPGHIGVFRTVQGNVEIKLSTNAPNGATSGVDWTYQQTTNAVLPINTWTNLVVTYANNTVIVYINGNESSRFFTSGTLFDKSTVNNNLNFGGSYINSGTTRYSGILGLLDDMSIYRIALSAKEVSLLAQDKLENANNDLIVRPGDRIYSNITTSNKLLGRSMQGYTTVTAQSAKNDYQASQMTPLGLPANTSAAIENIIEVPGALNPVTATNSYVNSCVFPRTELCVKFDETSTTLPMQFSDVSRNQSVLTCSNTAACPTFVASNWKFTSNTDISTSASVGNAISSRDFTVSLWVKPEDQSVTNRTIVMSKGTAVLKLALANEYPQFTIGSTTLAATTRLVIGQWQHLVFRLMLGKRQIFVDGVNVASDTAASAYNNNAFGELRIGKDATTNSLMGSLRDIQINSLALSDSDIATLAKTCEDPRLIACMPFNASTTAAQSIDYSRYGIDQGVALNCSGCTTSNNSEISFASSTTASLPNGYASLINDHDFSIMLKIKLASVAGTQTIMQSSVITSTGNQLQIQVVNGRPTVVRKNVVAGVTTSSDSASIDNLTLSANTWYVLTAKQSDGRLSMTAYTANGSALQSASKEIAAAALTQAQEPLTLGTTGLNVDLLRMYRTGLSSANMAAMANYALFGNLSINLNQAPQSDRMPITVEARNKIIVPDANFERIRGNCDESSVVLCVPFDRDMNTAYPDPMANATATQSSTYIGWPAQNAMDKNFGTMNHTNADANAWLHFDLGQVRDIATVTIYDRADGSQNRSDSAKVFVSTEPIGGRTPGGLIAQGGASDWKNMKCDNQNQTQVCASKNVFDVTFAKGTRGRYVYITVANNYLHFREVVVNSNSDIQSCNRTNTCPTFNAGGNEFVSANKQSITLSANLSQSTFNGTKNYTVMSWIKLKDPMSKNVFIGDNSGIADGLLNTDSNFRVEGGILRVGPTACTDCEYYLNDNNWPTTNPVVDRPLVANTWYHVALMRSGTTQTIYLNGVRYMSKAAACTFNNVRQMEIGGASGQLNGSLRDFQIHGTALAVPWNASKIKLSANNPAFELRMPLDEPALSTAFSDVLTTGLQ
ncbi:MAG: discoidin domain-containing protein, partial [Chloroflexales bacterium]|nr:discoidin domain-containing protein [Chloroflexales bacterium]